MQRIDQKFSARGISKLFSTRDSFFSHEDVPEQGLVFFGSMKYIQDLRKLFNPSVTFAVWVPTVFKSFR